LNKLARIVTEYRGMARILKGRDYLAVLGATAINVPGILKTGTLASVDAAMSRNMSIAYRNCNICMPLADIDYILAEHRDNPSFGNVREIFARDCYLWRLCLEPPQRHVLDLGANRGIFSILALVALQSEVVVGVEPLHVYLPVFERLLEANRCSPFRAPRYTRFISSPSRERLDPDHNVSIETILREQSIPRFNLVKMDIEGAEKDLFSEPEWLANIDSLTMEVHPQMAGDSSLIPRALERYGFEFALMDQAGQPAGIDSATFLVASSNGALGSVAAKG
jgi:Methyltransferase FkbM domain